LGFRITSEWRAFRHRTAGTVVVGLSWLPCSCSHSPYIYIYIYKNIHILTHLYLCGLLLVQALSTRNCFAVYVGFVYYRESLCLPLPTFSHTNQHKSAKSSGYKYTNTHKNTPTHTQSPKDCISSNIRGLSCKHRAGLHRVQ